MVIFITLCFVLFLKQGIPSLAEICLQNRFSKDNEPFKAEKLFQTQGGPIILSQPVSFCTSMGHSAPVLSVYFHPNNDEHICSCDAGSEIRYWRITVAFVQECFKVPLICQ
ncbi:uncharacterized protein [Malus domestica]|uniref:uncharacterized protein isoform X2 n=1 Tax=Malus domestica TaxID=3750 RepID=UPI0039755253